MSASEKKLNGRRFRTLEKLYRNNDVSSFSVDEWLKFLKVDSDLYFPRCPFKDWGPSEWARALKFLPKLSEICPSEAIAKFSGVEWVSLLKSQPSFDDCCNWESLSESDWLSLLSYWVPNGNRRFFGEVLLQEHSELFAMIPRSPSIMAWCLEENITQLIDIGTITGKEWSQIILLNPKLFRRCNLDKLSENDWQAIYSVRSQFL